jgi:hypothetical protein
VRVDRIETMGHGPRSTRWALPGFGGSKLVGVPGHHDAEDNPEQILRLLADPDRVRVVAAVVLGAGRVAEIASTTGIEDRRVARALARLVTGGLVVQTKHGAYRFAFDEMQRRVRIAPHGDEEIATDRGPSRVLGAFLKGGRLTTIPAARSKRLVVLDYLAQAFEPGRRYRERDVNKELARFHDDVAALRRYLVDEGFMTRAGGFYWRSGGSYEIE